MTIRIHKSYLKQELLTLPVLVGGISTGTLYLIVSSLMLNNRLLWETFSGRYTIPEKLTVFVSLLSGILSMYTLPELLIILLLGFLMGVNLVLIVHSLHVTKKQRGKKKSALSFGLGVAGLLATTGCASCGVTLLSFIGPSVTAGLLPFHGFFYLQLMSVGLLILSLIHTLNRRNQSCIIAQT